MIFSNKIYKLASGKNVSIYAEDYNTMSMFICGEKISKRKIIFSEIVRCVRTQTKLLEGNVIKKINNNHLCICKDETITVVNEEN